MSYGTPRVVNLVDNRMVDPVTEKTLFRIEKRLGTEGATYLGTSAAQFDPIILSSEDSRKLAMNMLKWADEHDRRSGKRRKNARA